MGKKDKAPKEDPNKLTEVDRTFYEITITDLNQKMSRLKNHLVTLDETNVSLSEQLKEVTENRTDLVAHLERSLARSKDTISELEERLVDIVRVRNDENAQSAKKIEELDVKFKSMQDQLTSEIKLLNGKLNSLDEFRIQRDILMAKFDEQEAKAKENETAHKELIYNMEQKAIVEKDELRKEMEVKLLQVSEDFARTCEIRNAGYTKRLIRENMALQREINTMALQQIEMQREFEDHMKKNKEIAAQRNTLDQQKEELIRSSHNKIKIIEKLTENYERLRERHQEVLKYRKLYENLAKTDVCERFTINDLSKKLKILGQRVESLKKEKKSLIAVQDQKDQENLRLKDVLHQIQIAIHIAIKATEKDNKLEVLSDTETPREEDPKITSHKDLDSESYALEAVEPKDIPAMRKLQRKNLLREILHIISSQTGDLLEPPTLAQLKASIYKPGKIGFLPRSASYLMEILKRDVYSLVSAEYLSAACHEKIEERRNIPKSRADEASTIIDVQLGASLYFSESHEDDDFKADVETPEDNDENDKSSRLRRSMSRQSLSEETQSVEKDSAVAPKTADGLTRSSHESRMSRQPSLPDMDDEAYDINLFY